MKERARRRSLPLRSADPAVFSRPGQPGAVLVSLRVPIDAAEAGPVKRDIIHALLEIIHKRN